MRANREQLATLLIEKERRRKQRLAKTNWQMMYSWQRGFAAATRDHFESCLCAGNQVGKTLAGTTIDAFHLLGDYPLDYDGHRFAHAPLLWGLGYSMEKTRDLLQQELFGKFQDGKLTGGLVPADRIVDRGWESAPGTPNAMRSVQVKHNSGSISTIQFWSYSQGQHALMGDVVDWFHVDEEPRDQTIRPQLLTRTINGDKGRGGRGIYTFTPENGLTELVMKFMQDKDPSQFFMQVGWDDAPHITPEKAARLISTYPEYQRDMRSKGTPMLGHGLIYPVSEEFLACDPPDIQPEYWVINGLDFGYDHPQAHVQLIEDRETGRMWVTQGYKAPKVSAADAWVVVKPWSEGVPVAWPSDGLQHEKGTKAAYQQKDHYATAGFNLLAEHATWQVGGNAVEPGLYEINDLIRKGLFKVCRHLSDVFTEARQYHRDKNGKRVDGNDDLWDAIRYAYMMRRFAVQYGQVGVKPKRIKFQGWGG